jgi:hypothetical protein
MTKQQFNFEEIFSFAWSKTKQHAWFLACMFVIYAVIMSAVRLVPFLEQLTALLCALSLLSMSLIMVRDGSFSFEDLFNRLRSPNLVVKFLVLTAIYVASVSVFIVPFIAAMSVTIGSLFLNGFSALNGKLIMVLLTTTVMFVPAIYIAIRFKFYPYVLLENENMKIVDVIKHTYRLTCCAFWQLLGFFITIAVLNTLGFLAFGVGLILTVPVSVMAVAHLFRRLEHHTH